MTSSVPAALSPVIVTTTSTRQGLYLLPVVCGWLIAVLSGALATWLAPGLGPAAILLVGLATPVWFYSVVFWEHTLATLFGLG